MDTKKRIRLVVCAVGVLLAVLCISGLLTGHDLMYHLRNRGALGPLTRDDIQYLDIDTPAPTGKDGTVNASDWASAYPYIVATMGDNSKNSYTVSYLEEDPYLTNIYEGYGFAIDYLSARGHNYTLEDVAKTTRPHPKANCLTCKTPNFAKLVNDQGVGVYSMPFEEVLGMMEENISCYTCHANNPGDAGRRSVTHSYVKKALGTSMEDFDPSTLVCGQCHIEYYFTRENSETMMPYHDRPGMTPEAILAYYDSFDFYDWIQESTGTKMLKTQHPEFETFSYGKHAALLNCADCHMPIEQADDGTIYHSHNLQSPLENETLLSTCARCHGNTDMVNMVHRLQSRVIARETEVGNKLSGLKDALAEAVSVGEMAEEELDAARALYREAQWFFDFCYVENSEGAHNSELAYRCLDTSEIKILEAMALLGK